jgi:Uma2 family endonuclease
VRYACSVTTVFPLHRYQFADYLRLEEESSTRHEFLDGEIVAMAGGTPEHAALAMAVGRQRGNQLAGTPCRVFSSDSRVRGLATYPDVSVVCGRSERDPDSPTTVTNPKVLVEVTSDGTEHCDHGPKLEHDHQIPSLEAVVVVSHRERRVEVWLRAEGHWTRADWGQGGTAAVAALAALAASIDVDALYDAAAEP